MGHNKRLIENIGSLTVLQGANYILPLIILPYLVRVLGPEKFGLIAFAQAFMQYFITLTDYGFNLTATRQIAINRDNVKTVSEIFSAVMFIKIGLMIVSFLIMAGLVIAIPKFRVYWPVYFVTFLMVLGNVVFPVWFFQGMERMKYITVLNVSAKAIAALAIFGLVHKESDFLFAACIQSAGMVIAGLLGLTCLKRVAKLDYALPSRGALVSAFSEGWHVFISTAAINLYTSSNAFILGLLTNNTMVGYFTAADKLVKAAQGLLTPISQAIYPHINTLATRSRETALVFIRKSLIWIGLFSLVISITLLMLAEPLVRIILGRQYTDSIPVLQWMAFLPFIVALSNVFGMQTMLTFGMDRVVSRILLLAGLINLLLIVPLACALGAEGAAISLLVTEAFVAAACWHALEIRRIHLLRMPKGPTPTAV